MADVSSLYYCTANSSIYSKTFFWSVYHNICLCKFVCLAALDTLSVNNISRITNNISIGNQLK